MSGIAANRTGANGAGNIVVLLDRIGAGDRDSLKTLYDATSAKLFGVILRILLERGEAEDVLQEVYITVWRKAAEFDATRASPAHVDIALLYLTLTPIGALLAVWATAHATRRLVNWRIQ